MKVVCAWCGEVTADGEEPISHGMCEWCAKAILSPRGQFRKSHGRWIAAHAGDIKIFDTFREARRWIKC